MTPYFSICIPQYNRTSFVIEACRGLVEQSFRDFEVCISDDQSTDGRDLELQNFLRRSGLSYVYKPRAENGRYDANLRSSIALAQGRYCFLMGNDDRLATPKTLYDLHAAMTGGEAPAVVVTNYADYATGAAFRRVQGTHRSPGTSGLAVREFRNFSFVSGVVLARAAAQQHATSAWDGSEMYQMYLACRMLAEGGLFFGWDHIAVRKDIRLPNERVDSYAQRPRLWPCPVIERRLPVTQIVRVVSSAISPYESAEEHEASVMLIAQQLLLFTLAFWIFEYRRVQSWRYALGLSLGMRPKNVLQDLRLSRGRRAWLMLLHAGVTLIGLSVPGRLFHALRAPLYRLAKAAHSRDL